MVTDDDDDQMIGELKTKGSHLSKIMAVTVGTELKRVNEF